MHTADGFACDTVIVGMPKPNCTLDMGIVQVTMSYSLPNPHRLRKPPDAQEVSLWRCAAPQHDHPLEQTTNGSKLRLKLLWVHT